MNIFQIVIVKIENSYYGFKIEDIQSIEENNKDITNMPNSAKSVVGVITYRDQVVPILCLAKLLETKPLIEEREKRKLMMAILDNKIIGFDVDEVVGIRTYTDDEVSKSMAITSNKDHILGIIKQNESYNYITILLDTRELVKTSKI